MLLLISISLRRPIEFYSGIVRRYQSLPQHGFLIYISDRSNAEITHGTLIFTAVAQNHGDNRKSRHTTKRES